MVLLLTIRLGLSVVRSVVVTIIGLRILLLLIRILLLLVRIFLLLILIVVVRRLRVGLRCRVGSLVRVGVGIVILGRISSWLRVLIRFGGILPPTLLWHLLHYRLLLILLLSLIGVIMILITLLRDVFLLLVLSRLTVLRFTVAIVRIPLSRILLRRRLIVAVVWLRRPFGLRIGIDDVRVGSWVVEVTRIVGNIGVGLLLLFLGREGFVGSDGLILVAILRVMLLRLVVLIPVSLVYGSEGLVRRRLLLLARSTRPPMRMSPRIRSGPIVLLRGATVGADGANLRRFRFVLLENGSDPLILLLILPSVPVRVGHRSIVGEIVEEVVLASAEERGGVPNRNAISLVLTGGHRSKRSTMLCAVPRESESDADER